MSEEYDPSDLCGREYTFGSAHDPYGTSCEEPAGHNGPHKGLNPLGAADDYVTWSGGGYCAGDPLPVTNVKWLDGNLSAGPS